MSHKREAHTGGDAKTCWPRNNTSTFACNIFHFRHLAEQFAMNATVKQASVIVGATSNRQQGVRGSDQQHPENRREMYSFALEGHSQLLSQVDTFPERTNYLCVCVCNNLCMIPKC